MKITCGVNNEIVLKLKIGASAPKWNGGPNAPHYFDWIIGKLRN
jgi:hypothetical protein